MTATQATIIGAIIASPLIVSVFDWAKNKILALINYRGWQAVFLANNQVYFGKITSASRSELSLKNIYYINSNDLPSVEAISSRKIKLTKLGEELHGPKDRMIINRGSIVFIENLKDDGLVVQTIVKSGADRLDAK